MRFSLSILLLKANNSLKLGYCESDQTRRRFGGRQPLCGIGVTSLMCTMCKPDEASARTADSSCPSLTLHAHLDRFPFSRTGRAPPSGSRARSLLGGGDERWPLRDPLKPIEPAEDQDTVRPSGPQIVMIVLLNVA